jgi:hypothetical protein
MKKIIPIVVILMALSCTKQQDEHPKFYIGELVEFNNICPNDNCNFHAQGPAFVMPMVVLKSSPAGDDPGHLRDSCRDSTKPVARTVSPLDYQLEPFNVNNKQ